MLKKAVLLRLHHNLFQNIIFHIMENFKHVSQSDRELTTRQSSKRTIFSRVTSSDIRSSTPLVGSEMSLTRRYSRPSKFCVKVVHKHTEKLIPRSEPPYLLMRNGIPFLYTPADISEYRPQVISPFGSNLRGSMIKGRQEKGNMFAMHCGNYTERMKALPARSFLNDRSKWK